MYKTLKKTSIFILLLIAVTVFSQEKDTGRLTIGKLKYGGGGDWYGNRTSLVNLMKYARENTTIPTAEKEVIVEVMDPELFSYPYLFMSGHGNVRFTDDEVKRLRLYLINGGFFHADDDYGMDQSFRREMKKVFPDKELVEIPFDHEIYHSYYDFPQGLPKVHEHDGGPPHGYGIFHEGRIVVFYSRNTDLADGWEDPEIHNDPPEIRDPALKMGVNIVVYALMN
ncbi:DUF4159 domain-containing protein [candidate division KSB1 bacterium]